MKRTAAPRGEGRKALELVEEATSLLRRAPLECLALYYLGTLPFVLAALYFWADMSRSAAAGEHLAGASLGLALLFLWMKFWQARFCAALSARLLQSSAPLPVLTTLLTQTILQPWSLVVLPLALLATIPFGWCFAFFQNLTVMCGGAPAGISELSSGARRQAALWPGQNHILMFIFVLLSMVIFANFCVGAFLLPIVLKTVLGVDSVFTRSHFFLLNSTFLAAMAGLTYLCVDPLVKAVYLLRCYYGDSLVSGADLLADLREVVKRASRAGVLPLLLVVALLFSAPLCSQAAAGGARAAFLPKAIPAQELDRTITQVVASPEFAWRLPRQEKRREEMPGFLHSTFELLRKSGAMAADLIRRFFKWLSGILPKEPAEETHDGGGFSGLVYPLMYGMGAISLATAAVLLWRLARHRRRSVPVEPAQAPVTMVPDLRDDNVTADQLSEERWSILARELLGKGELRLGLRALYLASLACLADQRLIGIARFKSNRDYQRELGRFRHALPEVVASFSGNVAIFEQAWYGMHTLEQGTLEAFLENHQRIVSCVQQR